MNARLRPPPPPGSFWPLLAPFGTPYAPRMPQTLLFDTPDVSGGICRATATKLSSPPLQSSIAGRPCLTASLARPKKLNPRCHRVRLTVAEEIRLMTALYALACFLWPRTFGDLNQHSEVPPAKNGLPV